MTQPPADLDALLRAAPADQIALYYEGKAVTYGELVLEAERVAAGLHARGLREGDRIAVWLPNIPAWLCLMFACARLGARTQLVALSGNDVLARRVIEDR